MNKFISLFSIRRLIESRSIATRLTADGKEIPKKKIYENRITLIGADNSVVITDLKNAENLSLRRELKLVKVQDTDSKTRRPVYKLMTNAEYHEEELVRRKEKQSNRQNTLVKGEKLLTLSTRIGDHDLMTGVKKIMKLLGKQYEVKVIVTSESGEEMQKSERIYSIIEKNIKSIGKVLQKRNKGNSLRFQLYPVKENISQVEELKGMESNSHGNDNDKGPL